MIPLHDAFSSVRVSGVSITHLGGLSKGETGEASTIIAAKDSSENNGGVFGL